jgi:hypothetical protein
MVLPLALPPLWQLLTATMAGTAASAAVAGAESRQGKKRNPLEDRPDALEIDKGEDSAFLSFLDTLGTPQRAVNNVLMGNWEGAGRNLLDFGGDILDAGPGDFIPHVSRRMDKPGFSDVAGGAEPGFEKFAVDVIGGGATDPLALVPGSLVSKGIGKAGNLAKAGVQKVDTVIPGTKEAVDKLGRGVRSTFGAQRAPPAIKKIIDSGRAGRIEGEAGMKAAKTSLQGLDDRQLVIIGDAIDNFRWQGNAPIGELADGDLLARISAHPDVLPGEAKRLADAAEGTLGITRNQKIRKNIFSPESQANLSDEYLQRHYEGLDEGQAFDRAAGGANAMSERKLKGWQEVGEYLGKPENAKVKYERNALRRSLGRSSQQGEIAKRADIGSGIMEGMRTGDIPLPTDPKELNQAKDALTRPYFHDNDASKATVRAGIEAMRKTDPEAAQLLHDAYSGMPKPGWIGKMLARGNEIFKPAATAGYALPNLAFNIRNRLSGIWSTLSNNEARGATGSMAKRALTDIPGAIADGLGLKAPDRLGKVLNAWEKALASSGGSAENAFRIMESSGFAKEASLIRTGVLDGFVRSEEILSELAKPGMLGKLHRMAKWPAKITKGMEDRMRLGLALDVLDDVQDPMEAARIARGTLFDYDVSSEANRAYRQAVPFGQFVGKAIPQQAGFLAEQPSVAGGLSRALVQSEEDPTYSYMEGKLNLPWLPDDEEGNRQYLGGFGLPFESLNQIPASFRDIKRNVVGSMTPPLKTLLGATFDEDPFFETPFGSYDKLPIYGEAGDVGRAYNVAAGTGLIQPLASPLRTVDKLLDDRKSPAVKALELLTGARVQSVDSDQALLQQLIQDLKNNPEIREFGSFYNSGDDDATDALLRKYQAAKAKMKAKRKAP